MKYLTTLLFLFSFLILQGEGNLPSDLKEWKDWVIWDDKFKDAPVLFNEPQTPLPLWTKQLDLSIESRRALFSLETKVFVETWVALPGNGEIWPQQVKTGDRPLVVVTHGGRPSVKLVAGTYRLTGEYRWVEVPPKMEIPNSIGILNLKIDGKTVENPNWERGGDLWLRRTKTEGSDQNAMTIKVYRLLEDGIPMWLQTQIELTVSGKSREENIGSILPEGWTVSRVNSPIPVMLDEKGILKGQVRSGKWIVTVSAYRTTPQSEMGYAAGIKPAVDSEWIAFQANPELRVLDLKGIQQIDVSQTSFPEEWRKSPVYQWNNEKGFQLEEKMRGMGEERRGDWTLNRDLWLDENGGAFTFRDKLAANDQTVWRLNSSPHQKLGSVKLNQQPQLITRHPISGEEGVEIRFSKSYQIEAVGKTDSASKLDVAGWDQEMKRVSATLHLPPGWKMIVAQGAESVHGDWISEWTLWDFFFWILVTLAVFRIWGISEAIFIGLALGLTMHEPLAPKYSWLALIIPLGLMKMMVRSEMQRLLKVLVGVVFIGMVFQMIKFGIQQVRISLYPNLESEGLACESRVEVDGLQEVTSAPAAAMDAQSAGDMVDSNIVMKKESRSFSVLSDVEYRREDKQKTGYVQSRSNSNLQQKNDAKVQTGVGIPEWNHRSVQMTWSNPVTTHEKIRLWMTPPWMTGVFRLLGLALAFFCLMRWIDFKTIRDEIEERWQSCLRLSKLTGLIFVLFGTFSLTHAESPSKELLDQLRERLLRKSDAFPDAASISSLTLKVEGNQMTIEAEVHAAVESAIPIPGRLPAWAPLSVMIGSTPASAVMRRNDYLWVLVPQGVSHLVVRGFIPSGSEWEFPFFLKPKQVGVVAPDWEVRGIQPGDIPEAQLFFIKKQKSLASEGSFQNQSDFGSVVLVRRELELGLTWRLVTEVERRWGGGKAVSIAVPLFAGEKVLTNGVLSEKGNVQVRLGANEQVYRWESELDPVTDLNLVSRAGEGWVEQWVLSVSPIWSVEASGLAPFFDREKSDLVAQWRPWSGEKVALKITRPEAVSGETCTIHRLEESTQWGKSQTEKTLTLDLQSSLGEDFKISGWNESEKIDALMVGGNRIPVRREGEYLWIPLKPGEQKVELRWRESVGSAFRMSESSLQFPVPASNIRIDWTIPNDRVLLWTGGPTRGPVVLIWSMLLCSIIVAFSLSRIKGAPLRWIDWVLLLLGFLQTSQIMTFAVVIWILSTVYRDRFLEDNTRPWIYNIVQIAFLGLTVIVFFSFAVVVSAGLLQIPDFSVRGNGSSMSWLHWYQAYSEKRIPEVVAYTIPIWIYRGVMLVWSIWLAQSLIRWIGWIWRKWSEGGLWKLSSNVVQPPRIPKS